MVTNGVRGMEKKEEVGRGAGKKTLLMGFMIAMEPGREPVPDHPGFSQDLEPR